MSKIKFMFESSNIPLEMHKVRIVQKLNLLSVEDRLDAIDKAGNNTFLLRNNDVFLDMLTDSGVNAMSDNQLAAMMRADDSYAGSATFERLEKAVQKMFHKEFYLPAHQGRACENIIAQTFVKEGDITPMNYHFTTTKAHIVANGGTVVELIKDEGVIVESVLPFKGDMDIEKLESLFKQGTKIAFNRIEVGTNLIGGQPVSLKNMKEVAAVCKKYGVMNLLDASLLADNLYFIKIREEEYKDATIEEITKEISDCFDVIYFSGRKLGCARGGGIITSNKEFYDRMKNLVPLYEGFITYGGMSVREMEAMAIGLEETMDMDMISQGPQFIEYMVNELQKHDVPVVTPSGGLGCHLNAMEFVKHIPQDQFPSASLASALYIISGIRGMERGTLSEEKNEDGSEHFANMELLRLALPRRVFTLSQVKYAIDRIKWLYDNRELIGGLRLYEEPEVMRFFLGKLEPVSSWQDKLVAKFKEDFGESL